MKKAAHQKKKGLPSVAVNKSAFVDIIGDPYAYKEIVDGHYMTLKSRNSITCVNNEQTSKSPVNGARPSTTDFAIDVESAVSDGLEAYTKQDTKKRTLEQLKELFDNTYLLGTGDAFNQNERAEIEQHVGRILVKRSISPVSKYFTTIKQ